MPTLRKVPSDIGETWAPARSKTRNEDPHYAWATRPATLFITPRQRWRPGFMAGDVLRVGEPDALMIGVVIEVRASEALVAIAAGGERWIGPGDAVERLGRVKGVSRIDQAKKMIAGRIHGSTHGWFVRVYEGVKPKMTCSFSDTSAGGRRAALRAALAFHAAHVEIDAGEGVSFV